MGAVLSAHIGYLFTEVPLRERFAVAKAAGFDAVEHPSPFELTASELRKLLERSGLRLTQITSGLGRSAEKGFAAIPGREAEFREGFKRALDYAEDAGAALIHVMSGAPGLDDRGDRAHDAYLSNLAFALDLTRDRAPQVMIEVISASVVPDYHMSNYETSFDVVAQCPELCLLVDSYHAAVEGIDPVTVIMRAGDRLAHMHFADHPGRHEPLTGSLDFAAIIAALVEVRFQGALGFEYIPSGPEHLGWMPDFNDPSIAKLLSTLPRR
jgi:hydroxypyruvate isomerase